MRYTVIKDDKTLKGTIKLEGSKSITNRVIIIKALCPDFFEINNFSLSEDSETLIELINSDSQVLDCKDGGTTFRFLTSFLAIHEGEVTLTGSQRLQQRPIGPLVDALRSIGAEIDYLGNEGYPPILIRGKRLSGNRIEIDASLSSQFVSSLLLIAPLLKDGLVLKLKGEIASRPYIQMTLNVMKHFGIHYDWTQSIIAIPHQDYVARRYNVESDWSAAAYYYSMAAMADEVDLKLMGLNRLSYQGDSVIQNIMAQFGVNTSFIENGVHLTKSATTPRSYDYDFRDCPDLAQTILACCAGLNIPIKLRGIDNLEIKESNRIEAMQNELKKLDLQLVPLGSTWNLGINLHKPDVSNVVFDTYNDHRMAMALAPLALAYGRVGINDPAVVAKSYPMFWEDLKSIGFRLEHL
ncbi:MAG: 3-phosphoshikimate 1-carboxyvinyltransferase [Chitinophagales bacterium]|nr:3-phosphoshikimate 1-carboxyvinyltransferase [Chitinophagales bacterium]